MKNNRFLIIILILLIIGAVMYLYQKDKKTDNTPEPVATTTPITNNPTTTTIKIALLGAQMETSNKANFRGCDVFELVEKQVPQTTTPLNAALTELFSKKYTWMAGELSPGNFLSSQKDLFFDEATIEDDIAKVYLTGKIGPLAGVCDNPRAKIQIEETALQFPTVKKVEIYLNGIRNDFTFSEKGDETMNITVFVQDKSVATDCRATKSVVYQIPKTTAVADASLKILFSSELKAYAVYKSVTVDKTVAKVMLASNLTPLGVPIGSLSSCQSGHLLEVLKDTLTQYPTIKSVELYSPEQNNRIEF